MTPRILCASIAAVLAAAGAARADTALNFAGDVAYEVERDEQITNSFTASNLDILATQSEGKFSFIGEMIVEAFGSNEFVIDIDRLEVEYRPRSWVRFRAGRIRSAFGYYGDAYQNGKFFMIPATMPQTYEGDGFDGIFPSHAIGAHVDFAYALGGDDRKLTLDAEVLNGRGLDLGEVPAFEDSNAGKAVNLRLRYVGGGLTAGGNLYVDDIPRNTTLGVEHPAIHELVLAGHVAYITDHLHVIGEAAWFHHREHGTEIIHRTLAAFGEAGYVLGDYTAYARFEYTHFSDADPYFTTSGIPFVDLNLLSVGVKYVASASVALKLEAGADVVERHRHAIAQAAFAF
jgi:hypothetical protein